MVGIEVVTAVAGISSAFSDSLTLYQDLRHKRRREKALAKEYGLHFDNSLALGSSRVQQECDKHFAALGRRLAIGNGTFEGLQH